MCLPSFPLQAYFRQGVALQYLGRHADALAAFASGLAQDPKSLQLLVGMVEAAMKSPLRGKYIFCLMYWVPRLQMCTVVCVHFFHTLPCFQPSTNDSSENRNYTSQKWHKPADICHLCWLSFIHNSNFAFHPGSLQHSLLSFSHLYDAFFSHVLYGFVHCKQCTLWVFLILWEIKQFLFDKRKIFF